MASGGLISSHANFRNLWIGDGVSKLGSQVVVFVMPVLAATTMGASTWEVGLLTTFAGLPFLLIGLPVGAWSDRIRRRPLLVAADIGRAATLAWVPVGYVLGVLTVVQLYVVQLMVGVGTVFFDVSQGAYLPDLVGRSRLVEANGRLEANRTVAFTAGPTVGGQLIQWLGAPRALVTTVLSYLSSAAWLASIRTQERRLPASDQRNLSREMADGIRFVIRQPFIRATTLHATTAVLCLSTRYSVEVLFLLRTVGLTPRTIGLLMSLTGLGAVGGAVLASRIGQAVGRTRTVLLSGLGMGLFALLIPLTSDGIGLLAYVVGAGMVSFWITANNVIAVSLRQTLCPDDLLGRMNASTRLLAWATLPLGGIVGGALGTSLGLRPTIWLTSAGLLLSVLWLVFSPTCRARDLPHN
jgi:MFS family permease